MMPVTEITTVIEQLNLKVAEGHDSTIIPGTIFLRELMRNLSQNGMSVSRFEP